MEPETQRAAIRRHLEREGRITPLDALDLYGCMRLGARIWELRQDGLPIATHRPSEGKQFAIYTLEKEAAE